MHEADRLIARALESVLETIPGPPGGDVTPPEQNPTAQPWAETAAPPGRNKRPLETLLEEYSARVAAAPGAVAGDLLILALMGVALIPIGLMVFRSAERYARRTGRLKRSG